MENINKTDFLFEVSWEICNKVGGIHTVVSTKAFTLEKKFKDNFILIGPYLNREGGEIQDFVEDKDIFKNWRIALKQIGLNIKIGRWNIIGKPMIFLVDFSPLFTKKDQIFTELWNTYKLDTLTGQWDFIEPAMFGYAAGMVIKSFHSYNLSFRQNVVAHFHEWMTGNGLLYLKKYAPQITTVFTTHATTVGRSLAGNNVPLYKMMDSINPEQKAKEFNILAKHSLEKIAAHEADAFTTVSQITANEAEKFLSKKVHQVTPNGFERNIVPNDGEYNKIKENAIKKLKIVSEALLGYKLSKDVKFIATSGRYEFKNKGIDVFIDAVAKLNSKENFNKEVVAFILVPANNYGPRKDLIEKLNGKDIELQDKFITHYLHDADFDPTIKKIKDLGFTNSKEQSAKIVFVPAYLNGNDGIFNLKYYDLLPGMKMSAFPSYYEPWGYTPLESLAFHVPTITTDLAGFGLWIKQQNIDLGECMSVLHRDDDNYQKLVNDITSIFITCSYKTDEAEDYERNQALFVSKTAQWKKLIKYYYKAYNSAIDNKNKRTENLVLEQFREDKIRLPKIKKSKPVWKRSSVKPNLPEKFKALDELSKNIWWEWNTEATELFEMIDKRLWKKSQRNPVKLLKEIPYERLLKLEKDSEFIIKYEKVYSNFKKYMNEKPDKDLPTVSYFSMEYGLTNIMKIYSGGLGILAGDYLKEASDKNIDMVAVGLMYKYGYFTQQLSIKGEQIVRLEPQNFTDLPIELLRDENGKPLNVQVGMPGRVVYMQIWRVNVGRIPLYLLDTDFEKNTKDDRKITFQLYGGDNEDRLKQEMILGIGGIRALRKLGIETQVYHSNEGHAAFINIERIWQYMLNEHLTYAEAHEMVRTSTLFTTHTPVPAGHDSFNEDLMMTYFGHYPERLKINWEDFIKLGKIDYYNKKEDFSMSHLAANLAQEINGVSYLHAKVTKKMFQKLWDGYLPEEMENIGYVTNGIHYQTWAAEQWKKLVDKYFEKDSKNIQHDPKVWRKIYEIAENEIWDIRNKLRSNLINFIKERINSHYVRQRKSPQQIVAIQNKVDDKILTLGFARRFATYKRAHLLFYNTERLSEILNNPERPVQIVFAGKAHPKDIEGQDLITRIVEISKLPQFLGKIVFIENYDMEVAKKLVQGVDVWINTPTRPKEASGTSGMKATMNGVLNLSVLDGWWVEGYKKDAGWCLPLERTYKNQEFQNQLDAEMIYEILENEIVPMFYHRDENNVPRKWIEFIKKSMAQIACDFTTSRMLEDYIRKFYKKLAKRKALLKKDDFKLTKHISAWKKRMIYSWDSLKVISIKVPDQEKTDLMVGNKYTGEVVIDLNEILPENIKLELIIVEEKNDKFKILQKENLKLINYENHVATYQGTVKPAKAGLYKYAFRIYPVHKYLPNRQDFPLLTWI